MESREALEHLERARDLTEDRERFARFAAVLVAMMAAFLAIAAISAERAAEQVLLSQAQASDAYNELEANSQKKHADGDAAKILRILGEGNPAAIKAAEALQRGVDTKYSPRETGLLAKAKGLEVSRDLAENHHTIFQLAEAAFQLAIVLTSVAIISRARPFLFLGGGLAVLGLLLLVDGLTSIVRLN